MDEDGRGVRNTRCRGFTPRDRLARVSGIGSDMGAPSGASNRSAQLRDLALLFLRLGATAFGGPAAHIALLEDEVVRRRGWLSREEFLDLVGATNLIPGPNSTEMAIHIGLRRAGWAGFAVAGLCFILPAALMVLVLAWIYVRFGTLPVLESVLYGIRPVIIAVVVQAIWGLSRTAIRTWLLGVIGLAAAVGSMLGANEIVVLVAGGLTACVAHVARGGTHGFLAAALAPGALSVPLLSILPATPFTLSGMFLIFVKIGAVLYGSGYVLLAFLRADFVERLGWLTESQLLDAVSVGQMTPGPVFTTATFVGYVIGDLPGAAVATAGIFLPSFVFVAISGHLIPKLRKSPAAGAFLDGVIAASLALMAVVAFQLGRAAITDVPSVLLSLASAILLIKFRVNSAWLIAGGGVAGWVIGLSGGG